MKPIQILQSATGLLIVLTFYLVSASGVSVFGATATQDSLPQSDGADFSQSEMRCLTTGVRELGTLEYEIVLRNTGNKRPENVQLSISIATPSVMLSSAPDLSFDVHNRLLNWNGTLDRGQERRFTISLITLPGTGGTMVSNGASVVWGDGVPGQGSFYNTQKKDLQCGPFEIRSKEGDFSILFTVGGIGFGWLEVVIVGYIVFAPLFVITVFLLVRRREKQRFERAPDVSWHDDRFGQFMARALSVFFVVCIPFVLFFASMFAEDIRRFVSYKRTTCTLLDKKIGHSIRSTGRMRSPTFGPLVSVKYMARGREIVSAGSPSVSGSTSKKSDSAERRLARYELGKSYPCWFDPEDPRVFVLTRSPSWGWYLLSILPLGFFFFSGRYLMKRLRRPEAEIPVAPIR